MENLIQAELSVSELPMDWDGRKYSAGIMD